MTRRGCGSLQTQLVILRGNSASGKSAVAKAIQARHPGEVAWVGQDVMRRDVLKVRDGDDNPSIGLIETVARYCLDQGFHVVLEGILFSRIYADMVLALVADHRGSTHCWRWELSFDETLRRHQTKPESAVYGAELMRNWYRAQDPIDGLDEQIFDESVDFEQAVDRIERVMFESLAES